MTLHKIVLFEGTMCVCVFFKGQNLIAIPKTAIPKTTTTETATIKTAIPKTATTKTATVLKSLLLNGETWSFCGKKQSRLDLEVSHCCAPFYLFFFFQNRQLFLSILPCYNSSIQFLKPCLQTIHPKSQSQIPPFLYLSIGLFCFPPCSTSLGFRVYGLKDCSVP